MENKVGLSKSELEELIYEKNLTAEDICVMREYSKMVVTGSHDAKLNRRMFDVFSKLDIHLPEDARPEKFKSVVPLFWINEKSYYEQFASGVLLEVSNEIYILTAAHVIKDVANNHPKENQLFFPINGEIHQVVGPYRTTAKYYPDDHFDFAYIKLKKYLREMIHGKAIVLRITDLDWISQIEELTNLVFTGYPFRKSKSDANGVSGELFEYDGQYCTDEKIYKKLSYSLQDNVITRYDLSNTTTRTGDPLSAVVSPEGISGGGIFSSSLQLPSVSFERNKLVGIAHHHYRELNIMVGTHIKPCLWFMANFEESIHEILTCI